MMIMDKEKVKTVVMSNENKSDLFNKSNQINSFRNLEIVQQQLHNNVIGAPVNNEDENNLSIESQNDLPNFIPTNQKPQFAKNKPGSHIINNKENKENEEDINKRRIAKELTNIEYEDPIEFETINRNESHIKLKEKRQDNKDINIGVIQLGEENEDDYKVKNKPIKRKITSLERSDVGDDVKPISLKMVVSPEKKWTLPLKGTNMIEKKDEEQERPQTGVKKEKSKKVKKAPEVLEFDEEKVVNVNVIENKEEENFDFDPEEF